MLKEHSTSRALRKKFFRTWPLAAAIAPILLLGGTAGWAKDKHESAVKLLTTIPIPTTADAASTAGALYSYDISWIDQATQLYYLADRSNNVVDVADASNSTFVTQLAASPPFAGFVTPAACTALGGSNCSGPNGVTVSGNFLFVTDGGSRVVTIRLSDGATVGDTVTKAGDPNRADELAFDPKDKKLLVINNADAVPFGTLIDVSATGALSPSVTIPLTFATGGAEQPVWDPGTQRFYLTIPEVSGVATTGAVIRINPITGVIENMFAVFVCSPAGLTLNPKTDELGVGCNTVFDTAGDKWSATDPNTATPYFVIMDAKSGFIQAYVTGGGVGDEVWFNSGDGHYYGAFSGGPLAPQPATVQGPATLGVIDAFSQTLDQLVPTLNVPSVGPAATPVHPAGTAHSVAANSQNNHVLMPLAANNVFELCLQGCIAVYGRSDNDKD
jgi:hypothetical protein